MKQLSNKIIFKKYQIKKLLSNTVFSNVYQGINILNKTPVALKVEKKGKLEALESEAFLLVSLKGLGIPEVISYGKYGPFKILVEELLGRDLEYFYEKYAHKNGFKLNNYMLINDICLIAIQGLDRFEYIHSKDIVHRDVKTQNFLIGRKDPDILYIIDFGFSRKYRSSRTGKHIKFSNIKKLIGSLFFGSINAMKGFELSRRDDLESFGYMLIYLAKRGNIPWLKYYNKNEGKFKKIEQIKKIKMGITEEVLCQGLPNAFVEYLKYVKKLQFEQTPDYGYLRNLFIEYLSKIVSRNELNKNIQFFWIKPKGKKEEKEKETSYNNLQTMLKKVTSFSKKSKSLIKIYHNIKSSFDKTAIHNFTSNIDNNTSENMGDSFQLTTPEKSSKIISENFIPKIYYQIEPVQNNSININTKNDTRRHNYFSILNNKNEFINLNKKNDGKEKNILERKLLNTINYDDKKEKFIRNKVRNEFDKNIINYSANTNSKALYNNINYNNLYFINNTTNNTTYQPLNRNQLLNKNYLKPKGNVKRIDDIIGLKRNIIYRPIFKAQ